jgi:GAF domain-containing protein
MALFDSKPRSASAHCVKKCTLLKINGNDFQRLLQEDTKIASKLLSAFISVMSGKLRQTSRELVTLYETGKIIGERQDLSSLSKKILKQVLFAIPEADAGLFALFNKFTDEYEVLAQEGYNITEEDKIIDKNETLVFETVNSGKTILIPNLKEDKRFKNATDKFYFGSSILSSPLMTMDKILGIVILTNKTNNNAFTPDNINLLSAVTSQTASAIQNAKHLQEEEDRKRLGRVFIR